MSDISRRIAITMALAFVFACVSSRVHAEPAITIGRIVQDQYISGTVQGMRPQDYGRYRVLVYVLTDQWYIHPYATGGPGNAWASIQPNGSWRIGTVKRAFSAEKVAVFVVELGFSEPSKTPHLAAIESIASETRTLVGTADYGKL